MITTKATKSAKGSEKLCCAGPAEPLVWLALLREAERAIAFFAAFVRFVVNDHAPHAAGAS